MKYNPAKKSKKVQKLNEEIIEIFVKNEGVMSTVELHNELMHTYKYKHNIKTTLNYIKALEAGTMEGVLLTIRNKQKHFLQDFRDKNKKELIEDLETIASNHQKKLESKYVIFAEEQTYMRLAMESIKELDTLSTKHHKEIEERLGIKHIESPYFIDNDDMESINMSHADVLSLKDAIRKDNIIEFYYTGKSRKDIYVVEPYKLIIFDGLWYLFGKDIDDKKTPYKTWRLIYIKDVNYETDGSIKHTMKDEYTESILKNVDNASFIVDASKKIPIVNKNIIVKLKIDAKIVQKFDHKAHISGDVQEPITQKDGSLIVTTKVNTIADIDSEIKSWLPYIEILEPLKYKKKFEMELCNYMKKINCRN